MDLQSLLTMLGGVGLFLYGMKLMGQSLERFAGAKMEKTLEKLTSNRGKGVLLGAGVTAVIQSSSATIIMVIGFLNAGILKLMQAVPIIMGANIGTTITAQILRLGDINNDNLILQMLKPASFAPICVVIGAFVMLISKKNKTKDKAGIAVGLGILFIGMSMMESSFKPLASSPAAEFFCFCRRAAGYVGNRCDYFFHGGAYRHRTEHRQMCDCSARQHWNQQEFEKSRLH